MATTKVERQERFIREYLANGRKIGKACKAIGIAGATYRAWKRDNVFCAKLEGAEATIQETRLDFYAQIIKDAEKCVAACVKHDPDTALKALAALAGEVWDTIGKRQAAAIAAMAPQEQAPQVVVLECGPEPERLKALPAPEKTEAA